MKHILSIHVHDVTTASEFDAMIELLQSYKAKIAVTDPAPGHPELPLMVGEPDDEGDLRWCVAGELDEPVRAAAQMGKTHALAEWARWVADGMPRKNRSGSDPFGADPLKVSMDDAPPVTQPEIGTRS